LGKAGTLSQSGLSDKDSSKYQQYGDRGNSMAIVETSAGSREEASAIGSDMP